MRINIHFSFNQMGIMARECNRGGGGTKKGPTAVIQCNGIILGEHVWLFNIYYVLIKLV